MNALKMRTPIQSSYILQIIHLLTKIIHMNPFNKCSKDEKPNAIKLLFIDN